MAKGQAGGGIAEAARLKQMRPYLILAGLTCALVAEVWVISIFAGGGTAGAPRAVVLPGVTGSARYSADNTRDMRDEDHTRSSDQASIQGNVLNPVESVFTTQDQLKRAEQYGIK